MKLLFVFSLTTFVSLSSFSQTETGGLSGLAFKSGQQIFNPYDVAQHSPATSRSFKKLHLDTATANWDLTTEAETKTPMAGQVSYFGFGSAATIKDYMNVNRANELSGAMNKAATYTLDNYGLGEVQSSETAAELSWGMRAAGLSRIKELGPRFDKIVLQEGARIEADGSAVIVEGENTSPEVLFDFSEAVMNLNNPYLNSED